jgi:predicted transcriptional regulator
LYIAAQGLGPLELDSMQIVWSHDGPVTVKQVDTVLRRTRKIAYTTVMTTCVRLAEKGILARRQTKDTRIAPYEYMPLLRRQDLLLARVEQVLAAADAVERQYIVAAIRGGQIGA